MKSMTQEEREAYGEKLPFGYTYDDAGRVLTFRSSSGYWHEFTYSAAGLVVSFRASSGFWYECTCDFAGNMLTYRDSNGVSMTKIAYSEPYALFWDSGNDRFIAGSRNFSRDEALAHWGSRDDDRARIFTKAIKETELKLLRKPCPFCGCETVELYPGDRFSPPYAICANDDCGAHIDGIDVEDVVAKWNRREQKQEGA